MRSIDRSSTVSSGHQRVRNVHQLVLVACVLVVAACSGQSSSATPATTEPQAIVTTAVGTTSPATTSPATTSPATTGEGTACTSGSTVVPAGAVSRQIIDVDGDGRPDTAWIGTDASGTVMVGVVTAAGGGTERAFDSASPVSRSILAIRVNDATPPIFLADDGRTVLLWAFVDCSLSDADNVQGNPYEFSLGFADIGTGVGCAAVDGTNQLVGLDATDLGNGSVDWSSTVVTVSGDQARNGTVTTGVYTSPGDDAEIALLHTVTCGDLTIPKDGLTLPQ